MPEESDTSEKVEQLTEIFHDVTDEYTTTETQEESHWETNQSVNTETVRSIIQEMVEEYNIQTSLNEEELSTLVRKYHDGESDKEIARALGTPSRDKTVMRARRKLHLLHDSDFDAPFDLSHLRELLDEGEDPKTIADTLAIGKTTVREYTAVITAETEAENVDHKYQQRFEDALGSDDQYAQTLSDSARASGLEDTLDNPTSAL